MIRVNPSFPSNPRLILPRVYALTDVRVSGLSHAEQVELLSAGGATLIQLREKGMPAREFYDQAKAAVDVAVQRGVQA